MFRPLTETLQMEGISTDGCAGCGSITFYNLHVADSAKIILVLIFFLKDDISAAHFYFGVFEKFFYFIVVNASIGNDVPQFFVIILMSEK